MGNGWEFSGAGQVLVGIGSVYMTLTARRRAVLPCSSLLPLSPSPLPLPSGAGAGGGRVAGIVERGRLAGAAPGACRGRRVAGTEAGRWCRSSGRRGVLLRAGGAGAGRASAGRLCPSAGCWGVPWPSGRVSPSPPLLLPSWGVLGASPGALGAGHCRPYGACYPSICTNLATKMQHFDEKMILKSSLFNGYLCPIHCKMGQFCNLFFIEAKIHS